MSFGSVLGAFGNSYPQYVQNQQNRQMNDLKMQQAIRQMAIDQQNRQAQMDAIKGLSSVNGAGPGGTITPQQLAGLTNNPEAFSSLNSVVRPANSGMYNLAGRDIAGQYNLAGRDITGQYGLQREGTRAQAMEDVAGQKAASAKEVQALRNEGTQSTQKLRNEGSAATQKIRNERPTGTGARAAAAANPINSPEYRTAKSEFEEAKRDERNIEAHYPLVSQAYNDPQWLDARKRALAAQGKMESIASTKQPNAEQGAPAAPAIPPEAAKQLQEGLVTTFANGQKWTLENGQPKQVE